MSRKQQQDRSCVENVLVRDRDQCQYDRVSKRAITDQRRKLAQLDLQMKLRPERVVWAWVKAGDPTRDQCTGIQWTGWVEWKGIKAAMGKDLVASAACDVSG